MTLAAVAREWRNWQTRWLQVPVFERTWGFKSPLAHHRVIGVAPPRGISTAAPNHSAGRVANDLADVVHDTDFRGQWHRHALFHVPLIGTDLCDHEDATRA